MIEQGVLKEQDYAVLRETMDKIVEDLSGYQLNEQRWGLLHADLHEDNYLAHDTQLLPIDFSCCGFGPFLLDVAVTCLHLDVPRRKQLAEAYMQERGIAGEELLYLDAYIILAVIRNFAFHTRHPHEHEGLRNNFPFFAEHYCRPYLNRV
ncbi:phosphotransferase [Paenibacillus lutrae]|uniref:Phosphotransferase n=1 Tax=Paenibacillus lutrae TaxID=2078573 RepID=A0A7X3FHP1_9BACL|nr:phosphotransferase [Paenibacillus lutrae]MVO99849.1 phosphotransferase [Paenibacillus lutrae]